MRREGPEALLVGPLTYGARFAGIPVNATSPPEAPLRLFLERIEAPKEPAKREGGRIEAREVGLGDAAVYHAVSRARARRAQSPRWRPRPRRTSRATITNPTRADGELYAGRAVANGVNSAPGSSACTPETGTDRSRWSRVGDR